MTVYWVDLTAGNDANDGLTLETAKLTPEAAFATADLVKNDAVHSFRIGDDTMMYSDDEGRTWRKLPDGWDMLAWYESEVGKHADQT